MADEELVWEGGPSQVSNLGTYLFCFLLCWLVVPIFVALYRYLRTRTTRYQLTSQRLKSSDGVLSKRYDEVELYRVKDFSVSQTFFERLFGLGSIGISTSDKSHPEMRLPSLRGFQDVKEQLRRLVEEARQRKGVREFD